MTIRGLRVVGRVSVLLSGVLVLSGCWPWRRQQVVTAPPTQMPDVPSPGELELPPELDPPLVDPRMDPPAEPPPVSDYPVARRVPGRAGMVFSPYGNRLVNVEGMTSGMLVADPHFPAAEKKYFHVP